MGSLGFQELVLIATLVVILIPYVLFLLTLQKALKVISPANRTMEPGTVWLMLIPFVGAIILFMVANAIGGGFKREFDRYAIFKQDKPTYNLGLTLGVLACLSFVNNIIRTGAIITGLLGWAIIIIWIVYWVQVNKTKNELERLKTTLNLEPGEESIFV